MGICSQLARFAVNKNHRTPDDKMMKPKLFQPDSKLKLSVFRIEDKTCEGIKEEGKKVVRKRPDTDNVFGWATISAVAVQNAGLKVCDDDKPPGHSSIVGWPKDEQEIRAYQHKLVKLAEWKPLPQPIHVT